MLVWNICTNINTDYVIESVRGGKRLASLFATYNLLYTVNFATGIQNNPNSAIYNIFVYKCIYYISHNKWLIRPPCLNSYNWKYIFINKFPLKERTRYIGDEKMTFQTILVKETWDCVCIDTDCHHMFNSFLCTFLNIVAS
jgi:hypothetical protein